jgi:hypothetical protein
MEWLKKLPVARHVAFVLVVFALWSVIGTAWYVCGVRGLCTLEAEANSAINETDINSALSVTQVPLMTAFERSGAAGEIFVVLLIAFVLGALLGRILATSKTAEQLPLVFELQNGNMRTGLAERVGAPTHVSAFTKNATLAAASATAYAAKPASFATPTVSAPILMPAMSETERTQRSQSLVGTATLEKIEKTAARDLPQVAQPEPRPILQTSVPKVSSGQGQPKAENRERPKVRFNTSWSNPYRGK